MQYRRQYYMQHTHQQSIAYFTQTSYQPSCDYVCIMLTTCIPMRIYIIHINPHVIMYV